MKKSTLLLTLLLCVITLFGQQANDKGKIVQKCIDLEDLQKLYPQTVSGAHSPVYILLHGVSFESEMKISKFGQVPVYVKKEDLTELNIVAFFLFHTLEIGNKTAHVCFAFYYDNRGNDSPLNTPHVKYELDLTKDAAGEWNIMKINSERR